MLVSCFSHTPPKNLSLKGSLILVVAAFFATFLSLQGDSKEAYGAKRYLSANNTNNECLDLWEPPNHDIPDDIDWFKTLVVGFPSGDKRLAFMQFEGLTGWAARDEWAYEAFGMTNHPFIKTNYPHYDGAWGWEDAANQSVLVVRNVRRTLTEFHHIMWDLQYATNYAQALAAEDRLFETFPPDDHFLVWRDERVMGEIHWYGWFVDYWMEGGVMRDVHTHQLTLPHHWFMFYSPDHFHKKHRSYEAVVGNTTVVLPSYDQRCKTKVSGGCAPVAVISAEHLLDPFLGPTETAKLAKAIQDKPGISDFLIEEDKWSCIWEELIINKKGAKTFLDREGLGDQEYNFSEEMLNEMIDEVDRLIVKYSEAEWQELKTAQDLVGMLQEHKVSLLQEVLEVESGERVLKDTDFLGPATRRKMQLEKLRNSVAAAGEKEDEEDTAELRDLMAPDYRDFFDKLEEKMHETTFVRKKEALVEEERRSKRLFLAM